MRQSAVIAIGTIGTTSVVLESRGSFTEGFLDQASDRLTRVAGLEFPSVTLDLHGIAEIDRAGQALISAFVMHVRSTGGQLSAVDPGGLCGWIAREHSIARRASPGERSRAA